jgi:hypothetical protein
MNQDNTQKKWKQQKRRTKKYTENMRRNKTRQRKEKKIWSKYQKGGANKQMNCAPNTESKTIHKGTCFTPDIMIQLKASYNNQFPKKHITSENPAEIWKIMHEELSSKPDAICGKKREDCWLDTLIKDEKMREKIEDLIFRPEQPEEWSKNPDEWLSNYDIFEVAKQYENVDSAFKMISPTPIDYDTKVKRDCVSEDLCNFNLKEWKQKGKTKFGIVFNLDKHNEPGSHWVSLWIDTTEKIIIYFDSAGNKLPNEVKKFINTVESQGKQLDPPIDFIFYKNGSNVHQTGNTECGMYSLFFLITMLTGKIPVKNEQKEEMKSLDMKERIDLFMKGKISDETVFDYRDLYFNPE